LVSKGEKGNPGKVPLGQKVRGGREDTASIAVVTKVISGLDDRSRTKLLTALDDPHLEKAKLAILRKGVAKAVAAVIRDLEKNMEVSTLSLSVDDVLVQLIEQSKSESFEVGHGHDEYAAIVEKGIIDPTKVVRGRARQNAFGEWILDEESRDDNIVAAVRDKNKLLTMGLKAYLEDYEHRVEKALLGEAIHQQKAEAAARQEFRAVIAREISGTDAASSKLPGHDEAEAEGRAPISADRQACDERLAHAIDEALATLRLYQGGGGDYPLSNDAAELVHEIMFKLGTLHDVIIGRNLAAAEDVHALWQQVRRQNYAIAEGMAQTERQKQEFVRPPQATRRQSQHEAEPQVQREMEQQERQRPSYERAPSPEFIDLAVERFVGAVAVSAIPPSDIGERIDDRNQSGYSAEHSPKSISPGVAGGTETPATTDMEELKKRWALLGLPETPSRMWTPRPAGRPPKGVSYDEELFKFIRDVYGDILKDKSNDERQQVRSYIFNKDEKLYDTIIRFERDGSKLPPDIGMPTVPKLLEERFQEAMRNGLYAMPKPARRAVSDKLGRIAKQEQAPKG
jgi:hypothetical protein